jgi:hypothetical protein
MRTCVGVSPAHVCALRPACGAVFAGKLKQIESEKHGLGLRLAAVTQAVEHGNAILAADHTSPSIRQERQASAATAAASRTEHLAGAEDYAMAVAAYPLRRRLKWLTLALFAYFGTVMVVGNSMGRGGRGFSVSDGLGRMLPSGRRSLPLLGTTPYLFFWQAAQEVEDIRVVPERKPRVNAPRQGAGRHRAHPIGHLYRMAFSNLVALAIIVTTAEHFMPVG